MMSAMGDNRGMRRVVVIGSSGSGKTTVARHIARALDLPRLELDSVVHQPGWAQLPQDEFTDRVTQFVSGRGWVIDGNYTSLGVRDSIWPRVDTVVWLDLPRWVIMPRVIMRTLRRVITQEELWNQNREPWTNLYSLDPYKNIIVWAWTRHRHVRAKFESDEDRGAWDHATVHRLRSPTEVARFLATLPPGP
jgi:adenylate kinase family enzyme